MNKRKPATASKRAQNNRTPAAAARAQRNKQAFVKSAKDRPLRSPVEVHGESEQEAPIVESRAILQDILRTALQDGFNQKMTDNHPNKGYDLPTSFAGMQAYQAKLLEATYANMQFAFELIQRLATIRSPFEFWAVIAEFTGRRIIMIQKDSKELAAFWRIDSFRERTALPRR